MVSACSSLMKVQQTLLRRRDFGFCLSVRHSTLWNDLLYSGISSGNGGAAGALKSTVTGSSIGMSPKRPVKVPSPMSIDLSIGGVLVGTLACTAVIQRLEKYLPVDTSSCTMGGM